jgi:hypothetical protein
MLHLLRVHMVLRFPLRFRIRSYHTLYRPVDTVRQPKLVSAASLRLCAQPTRSVVTLAFVYPKLHIRKSSFLGLGLALRRECFVYFHKFLAWGAFQRCLPDAHHVSFRKYFQDQNVAGAELL